MKALVLFDPEDVGMGAGRQARLHAADAVVLHVGTGIVADQHEVSVAEGGEMLDDEFAALPMICGYRVAGG
ncbi:hypothetical protein D3C87_1827600 [compost metagenome]